MTSSSIELLSGDQTVHKPSMLFLITVTDIATDSMTVFNKVIA